MMNHMNDSTEPYRILVAIGEPNHLAVLLALAVPLAQARKGKVTALCVGKDEEPPPWLTIPADMQDVVDEPTFIHDDDVSGAILSTARRLHADLLLLHWKGKPSRGRYLLGRTLDPVIQAAPCDVAVLRVEEKPTAFVERMSHLSCVLVPLGGGPNATLALDMALDLGPDAQVTALRVANKNLGSTAVSAQWDALHTALEPRAEEMGLRPQVRLASGIVEGILDEAAQCCDLVLLGATRESLVDRLLFGNLPQKVALKLPLPLVIVRRCDPGAVAALRRVRWRLLNLLPQLTLDERVAIYHQVRRGTRTSTDFYVMMTLSAAIASLGLLLSSPTVIIGAMLMAPMMSALIGVGMGIVQGDIWLLRPSLRTTALGAFLVIGISGLVGLVVPGRRITEEMLGRSSPTLIDLAVALVSGAAAAYAIARRDVASALAGVAIAVALVPPLATLGLAAISGDGQVAFGASLLFLTNLAAIVSAAAVVFLWMGFRPNIGEEIRARTFKGGLLGTAVLLLCITVILGVLTVGSIRHSLFRGAVQRALVGEIGEMGSEVRLISWDMRNPPSEHTVQIDVSVEASRSISREEVLTLRERLAAQLRRSVQLSFTVIPATHFDLLGEDLATLQSEEKGRLDEWCLCCLGKAEKYPLSDVSLHGCPVKCCSIGLFVAALPWPAGHVLGMTT